MKKLEKDKYEIVDKKNQKSTATIKLNKERGSIDLKIGDEISRTRLFSFNKDTVVIHIGTRWKQMKNPLFWFFYKIIVDKDFKNAKKIIEKS